MAATRKGWRSFNGRGAGNPSRRNPYRRPRWQRRPYKPRRRMARYLYLRTRSMLFSMAGAVVLFLAVNLWSADWKFAPTVSLAPGPGLIGRATVIDGDTIEIRGQRVRLWGVDAPESAQVCTRDGKPWHCGRDAASALGNWLGVRTAECQERTRDQYHRIVALCRVGGADVSAWLVESGWAMAFRRHSGDYVANEDRARSARRGVWGGQFQAPWEWRVERR